MLRGMIKSFLLIFLISIIYAYLGINYDLKLPVGIEICLLFSLGLILSSIFCKGK